MAPKNYRARNIRFILRRRRQNTRPASDLVLKTNGLLYPRQGNRGITVPGPKRVFKESRNVQYAYV